MIYTPKKFLKNLNSQVSRTSQNTHQKNFKNPETQQTDEREKESDQIGEATCLEHIREKPREKKRTRNRKREELGSVGLGRRASRSLA